MGASVHLRKKRGQGGVGEATARESTLATSLWDMLYANDAGIVSQSTKQPRKMMGVIDRGRVHGVWSHRIGGHY